MAGSISWEIRIKIQGTRHKVQGTRYKVQDTRYKAQGSRHKIQGTRYKVQGSSLELRGVQLTETLRMSGLVPCTLCIMACVFRQKEVLPLWLLTVCRARLYIFRYPVPHALHQRIKIQGSRYKS